MDNMLIGVFVLVVFIIVVLVKTAVVVEQQYEYVIERLGKYRTTLEAGFHILIPFFDKVAYKRSLKEQSIDIPAQTCITADNVSMEIDGCLYLQVVNSRLSAYGIDNYHYAVAQLAQTSLRSAIGKISLDNTFEARENLNQQVVDALDEASQNWGVKVLRYEIKDLTPPAEILRAMQAQITAEREKRALIAASEGRRQEQINIATGEREAFIARSEGEKQAAINNAQGEAAAITAVADATAQAIERIAAAIRQPGGEQAVQLKVAEKAVEAYGKVAADATTTLIVPSNMTEVSALVSSAMKMIQTQQRS